MTKKTLAEIAQAHRELADFLSQLDGKLTEDLPYVSGDAVLFSVRDWAWEKHELTVAQRVKQIARAIGGRWHKNDPKAGAYEAETYRLKHDQLIGDYFSLSIVCVRDEVCERRQVGTEKVIVPAVAAVEEHEEERPVFEYECRPLNDAAVSSRTLDDELAELSA